MFPSYLGQLWRYRAGEKLMARQPSGPLSKPDAPWTDDGQSSVQIQFEGPLKSLPHKRKNGASPQCLRTEKNHTRMLTNGIAPEVGNSLV